MGKWLRFSLIQFICHLNVFPDGKYTGKDIKLNEHLAEQLNFNYVEKRDWSVKSWMVFTTLKANEMTSAFKDLKPILSPDGSDMIPRNIV